MTDPKSNIVCLEQLCSQRLSQRRLILASNRGPIEYHLAKDGQLQARRGSGGVVTALTNLSKYIELSWIASAMGEGDRRVAREAEGKRIKLPSAELQKYLPQILWCVLQSPSLVPATLHVELLSDT